MAEWPRTRFARGWAMSAQHRQLEKWGITKPIVLAPMAGGPSTTELCLAVARAGGLPFIASGYLTVDATVERIEELSSLIDGHPFGVNLFVPDFSGEGVDRDGYLAYRNRILRVHDIAAEKLPEEPTWTDDFYAEKLNAVLASDATFVSFAFGYPSPEDIARLQGAGKVVVLYATSRPGVDAVIAAGADVIGIQGVSAGGHRASVDGFDDASEEEAVALVSYAASVSDTPIVAGGGVSGAADVTAILDAGASAVQVGTLFLLAEEAGTKPTHRRALEELTDRETVLTHVFTGKSARAIGNRFITDMDNDAPSLYPSLHYLTAGMRADAAAADDPEHLHLWAGAGFPAARRAPATEILDGLLS